MSNWKRFNHRDCPVCNGLRNDCRQNLQTQLIHCRHPEADPPDYIFRGFDSIGFGMWANKKDTEDWKQEQSRELREQRQRERERRREREQAYRNFLLSDSERDLVIRNILSQLELSAEHHQHLQERGISEEQITAGMYRSVQPYQKLKCQVDTRLAGVHESGTRLNITANGILCPIPNEQGQFLGWQIRFDDATRGNLPKYLWASSKSQSEKNNVSVHLKCGELPLAFHKTSADTVHPVVLKCLKNNRKLLPVALTEGVSFKPAITAQRLGLHTIGASGGNFASSPKTLEAYLKHIQNNHQGRKIVPILFADAGCLYNPSVLKVYDNTFRKLKELGFQLKVAWWKQSDKYIGDIDEITNDTLSFLELLSYQDFVDLAKKNQYFRELQELQSNLQNLTYQPNVHLNTRYLPDLSDLALQKGLVALKSPKGTGKSVQIKKIIKYAKSLRMNVISITPRRALGTEQSLKWEINWIGDSQVPNVHPITVLENLETIGLCWDSLWKLAERDWSHTIIIIDEVETALSHLMMGSTCKDKRPAILKVLDNKLKECLANKGMVLIADADLTNPSLQYFQAFVPFVPTYLITNDYQGQELQYEINFHTGRKDYLVTKLIADLAIPVTFSNSEGEITQRQKRLVIPVDSKDDGIALKKLIQEKYPTLSIVEVNSITTETDEGREFVEHPNEKIAELMPDVLIYTPSMGIGVSIDLSYFDRMYAFFTGVLQPNECRQMLGRVRETIPRSIWCRTQGHLDGFVSFSPQETQSRLLTISKESSILCDVVSTIISDDASDLEKLQAYNKIFNIETGTWHNHHIDLYSQLKSRKDFGLYYLAVELRRQLALEGHSLTDYHNSQKTEEGRLVDEQKKSLARVEAEAIAKAQEISLEDALLLKQKVNTTQEQRHQITKAFVHAELPGIDLTSDFLYKAVTKDRRKWLNQQKLFWCCQNYEITKILDKKEWLYQLGKFADSVTYLPDVKTYIVQVKLLKDLGILDLIDLNNPEKDYSSNDIEIKRILLRAKKRRKLLRYCFNLKITEKTKVIQFINHLLKRIGLHLKFHHQSPKGAKGVRFYRLDIDKIQDSDRLAVLQALTTKWSHLDSEVSKLEQTNSVTNVESLNVPEIYVQPLDEVNSVLINPSTNHNNSP